MQLVIGEAVYRLIALTHDLRIPRGWMILILALLAWGLFFLVWLGVSSVLWLSTPS